MLLSVLQGIGRPCNKSYPVQSATVAGWEILVERKKLRHSTGLAQDHTTQKGGRQE